MEGLSITPASLRDLRPVLHLERVCFGVDAWPLLDVMSALVWPGGIRLKAVVGGRLVGLAIAEPAWSDGISMIASIGVDPEFRRRGIGSALLSRCESLLPGNVVRLTVRADNPPAIRMYERCGYTFFSRLLNYYRDGQAGLVMEKNRTAE
ncbi:MAG: GNAT family N-acetyltransferase [Anaerolineales bacterium]|nr:GNAT family N-acetyltransferase [Anaerolineales bacterium]